MFWTKISKATTWLSFTLSTIGLVLLDRYLKPESVLLFYVVGIIAIIISHTFLFMFCDIAENVENIQNILSEKTIYAEKNNYNSPNKKSYNNSYMLQNQKWVCGNCGKTNNASYKSCISCGKGERPQ